VKNLRAKIGDNPRNPKWLHTVHGVGYRFEDPTKNGQ
jgi:two-component system response regulator RegX3